MKPMSDAGAACSGSIGPVGGERKSRSKRLSMGEKVIYDLIP